VRTSDIHETFSGDALTSSSNPNLWFTGVGAKNRGVATFFRKNYAYAQKAGCQNALKFIFSI